MSLCNNRKSNKYVQKQISTYKIVVLGKGAVGKSATTFQFIQLQFIADYDPTIEDSFTKQCVIDNVPVYLDILDTSGQDEFAALRDEHIRRGQGFLIIYSVTDYLSYEDIEKFRTSILRVKDRNDYPVVICGNKIDLSHERVVNKEDAEELVKSFESSYADYVETSARTRENVDFAFHRLVQLMREFHEKPSSLNQKKPEGFISCCQIQ